MDALEMLFFKVLGHMPIATMFRSGHNSKSVKVRYLIVNAAYLYNIIIVRTTFNALKATVSILYLTMKYPLSSGEVGVIKDDQVLACKCYNDILILKKKTLVSFGEVNLLNIDMINLDP